MYIYIYIYRYIYIYIYVYILTLKPETLHQDAFLPHVESGLVTLVGATTENPSFALNKVPFLQGYLTHKKPPPPPKDHHGILGIGS